VILSRKTVPTKPGPSQNLTSSVVSPRYAPAHSHKLP
jgi:hypothetical protein